MVSAATMTDDELLGLPKNGYKYEYVEGELVMSPAKMPHERIGLRLGYLFELYLEKNPIAEVYGSSTGYRMTSGNLYSPDVSVVRIDRFPGGVEPDSFGDFAPDIAVEVRSPGERRKKLEQKIREYFANGASLVLVVEPKAETVTVYRPVQESLILQNTDHLDCSAVLPGFTCPVSEIFKKRTR
jgi:Uma2 family endonuclease